MRSIRNSNSPDEAFMSLRPLLMASLMALSLASPAWAADDAQPNHYKMTPLVASKAKYKAQISEKKLNNAWGISIRPAGYGGHFWITAKNTSFEYIGDVQSSADESLHKLHQDTLKTVTLPLGEKGEFATSSVFIDSKDSFVITQEIDGVEPITAASKFLFSSDGGVISAWTERKKADGTFDRAGYANTVIDESKDGAQFFGLAVNADYSRIYAANFGKHSSIHVYDDEFKLADIKFDTPFDTNGNSQVDPGEFAPFNVQALKTPSGDNHIFVSYAMTQACNKEGLEKGDCKKGELYAGEEYTDKPGMGRVAEFTEDGKLIATWNDGGKLSAPWGMAFAPENFGALSGTLLVANFGSGLIAAYNPETRAFIDYMRDAKSKPVKIEKIWGLLFGNGTTLGDTDALYFTSGPDDEKQGIFGNLRLVK
jgi:uncharacterized protein (TIGR03118 family)